MTKLETIEQLLKYGDAMALATGGREVTYAQLASEVELMYSKLSEICPTGSVVAIIGDYSVESIAVFLSLARLGCIVVPITTTVDCEIDDRMSTAGVEIVIKTDSTPIVIDHRDVPRMQHPMYDAIRASGSPGLVLFSSGSTGRPKAMVHDLGRLIKSFEGKRSKSLCFMVFLMFDHIGGINSLLNGLATGASLVLVRSRDPAGVAQLVERYRVNVLPASPTFLNLLAVSGVASQYDLSSIRMVTYGTEPMPESLLQRLRGIFPRAKFLQTFGTSETGIATTSSRSSTSTLIKFDDPNLEYRVVDSELWLRSQTQILGYLNASMESFTEDGWFRTGDLVEQEDGYLRIVGRRKEMINVGGEKVLPSEVESCVLELPEVKDCMAYGEKHALTGQCVAVQVVIRDDCQPDEIVIKVRKHCMTRLARYKVPARVLVVEATNFGERFKKLRLSVTTK